MCAENCTDFTDLSTNNPTGWSWSFPGGSPALPTAQNPAHIQQYTRSISGYADHQRY
ncbi:MAG: hypothetical protein IPP86_04265 [Bacteroidetes bacterium]|nr:hypothetical protein [Bacteroidota bacterium]